MPVRVQRKRTKGYRLPPNAVYVGRPTKWGNPFAMGGVVLFGQAFGPQCRADVVEMFRFAKQLPDYQADVRRELRGKDLVCWCPLTYPDGTIYPCHADVLLEWANGESRP